MARTMQVSDSVLIDAPAHAIWEQVADPTQMARWSPENIGANTGANAGADGEAGGEAGSPLPVGAVFSGRNRRGRARWTTECVVSASDPGRRFAFDVRKIGARTPFIPGAIASWAYDFEPVEGGTLVTETWHDRRTGWPDAVAAAFDKLATGGRLFADFQRRNIARTLAALKADFEISVKLDDEPA